jgi:hypothetical protein
MNFEFKVKPSTFFRRGLMIVFCGRLRIENIEFSSTTYRQFRSHFGTSPGTCAICWNYIEHILPKKMVYTHLLWALLFLKVYATESVLASKCDCDVKTYREKVWIVVRAIYSVRNKVVSSFSILFKNFG